MDCQARHDNSLPPPTPILGQFRKAGGGTLFELRT